MLVRFEIRRDTAANWTAANPILKLGEPGLETDSRKVKYGDGATAWNALLYSSASIAASAVTFTPTGNVAATDVQAAIAEVDTEKVAKAGDTMTGALAVPDDPYDPTSWNASANVPTKNALRDQIEAMVAIIATLAPLASPPLTGTPTAPTAADATSNTQIATTAFVHSLITNLINASPATLDTLKELADAIGDDPNFAVTVATSIATKLAKANNLSDLTSVATAQANLSLVPGTNVQAYDAELAAIAALVSAADKLPYFTGLGTAALFSFTAAIRTALSNLSGVNTGDQTITITGDAGGSGTGSFAITIGPGAVSNSKLAGMAQATFKMRAAGAGTGDPIDGTPAQAKTALAISAADIGDVGAANGVASLDSGGKVPSSQLPAIAITSISVVASQAAQLALTAQEGDVAVRSDQHKSYINNGGTAGTMADWTELQTPTDLVLSVNGFTGAVTISTITGNAGTATALQTARNIDGQSFNGAVDITVIAPGTHAATSKATPVDADEIPLVDSAAANVLKKLTWANAKATLKTYFDTIYQALNSNLSAIAGLTSAANKIAYFTGAGVATLADFFGIVVSTYVPTASSASGSFGTAPTVTAFIYTKLGPFVAYAYTVGSMGDATAVGTAAGALQLTMPHTTIAYGGGAGEEFAIGPSDLISKISSGSTLLRITKTGGATVIAPNAQVRGFGFYFAT